MTFTSKYKPQTKFIKRNNIVPDKVFPIALDIGYSAVKGMAPDSVFVFPAFTRIHESELIGAPHQSDIFYKDETGVMYAIGELALDQLQLNDTNDNSNSLYGRERYYSKSFLILCRVGLAVGIRSSKDGPNGKPVLLQTGLPPAYRETDTALLVDALSGHHSFDVKIGASEWEHYEIDLPANNISVTSQPIGSVYSASKRNDGSNISVDEDGHNYLDSHTLVFDGGFGTLDLFSIANRVVNGSRTYNNLGMKAVFEGTAADIRKKFNTEIHVHTLPRLLEKGTIKVFNRKERSVSEVDFSDILKANTERVFNEAMDRIEQEYPIFTDYDYLIVTGGTGQSWYELLKDRYKNLPSLKIVLANQNDSELDLFFSNVRGYYLYSVIRAMHEKK